MGSPAEQLEAEGAEVSVGDGRPALEGTLSSRPMRLAVDAASGDVLITDAHQCRVRRVADGVMTTIAGNGSVGYAGDGGPATEASLNWPHGACTDAQGHLYIADTLNYRVRRVDAATGVISTVAGNGAQGYSGDGGPATEASLAPNAVAVDREGHLFISVS